MRPGSVLMFGLALAESCVAGPASAGPNANAKILLHVVHGVFKNPCADLPACGGIETKGHLYPDIEYLFIKVTDGDATAGIAGVQFGIEYDGPGAEDGRGIDLLWALCATLEFSSPSPPWPESGSGNLVTWDTTTRCQRQEPGGAGTGVHANVGYFYMTAYEPAGIHITPRPVDGLAKVADCNAVEDIIEGGGVVRVPSHLGAARFSQNAAEPGYNPCGLATPVERSTWSGIKTLFRH